MVSCSSVIDRSASLREDHTALVERLVADILNRHDHTAISTIFSESFRDHDPLHLNDTDGPRIGSVEDVYGLVRFLSNDTVDMHFVLERAFASSDHVAYRIFGQGFINMHEQVGEAANNARSVDAAEMSILRDMHIVYHSTGMFKVKEGKLRERWGVIRLETNRPHSSDRERPNRRR